jgi:hypothetical protein
VIGDARMFTHGFGRILLSQSVYTVVDIALQPCDAMDGKGRGIPGSTLLQEIERCSKPSHTHLCTGWA